MFMQSRVTMNKLIPLILLMISPGSMAVVERIPAQKAAPQSVIKVLGKVVIDRVPAKPLQERVHAAESVFVGKVVNKVVAGDWARAELEVLTPLKNAKKGAKVLVTWRIKIAGQHLFDINEGAKYMALLKGKHEKRYWLHGAEYKGEEQLSQVKSLLIKKKEPNTAK